MPEGDTIFRAAATLSRAIGGKIVRRFHSPLPALAASAAQLEGRRIERVEARGKNLLIHFEDGSALHTHMRMTGSWHIYRPGEAWQKPARYARAVIETDDFVAVCFNAPVVDRIPPGAIASHPSLSKLGPDILKADFDADLARRRLRERAGTPIGEALMNQQALAGIGNIYKSESLFACRVDPWLTVGDLPDESLDALIRAARELMSQNLSGPTRITAHAGARGFFPRRGPRYCVYDRAGEPCLTCGEPIRASRASRASRADLPGPSSTSPGGVASRVTYWCPACQPPGSTGALSDPKT